ncbi:MAG: hypothetical protein R3C32_00930 [Chloroflexota bacterium]
MTPPVIRRSPVRRRLPVVLAACLALATVAPPGPVAAQDGSDVAVVTLSPVGDATVSGLAVLTPGDAGTAANVVAVGAPTGAMAVIHAGSCVAIDPTPVGLTNDVGTTGQLATTVPLGFDVIADGAHVLAIIRRARPLDHAGVRGHPSVEAGPDEARRRPDATTVPAGERFEGHHLWLRARLGRAVAAAGVGRRGARRTLSNNASTVSFVAFEELPGEIHDVTIRDWEGRLPGLLRAGTVADFSPVAGDEPPGDADRAVGSYQYLYKTDANPAGSSSKARRVPSSLSSSSVIEVTADSPADAMTQAPLVEALIGRLDAHGTAGPSAAPATPAAPTHGAGHARCAPPRRRPRRCANHRGRDSTTDAGPGADRRPPRAWASTARGSRTPSPVHDAVKADGRRPDHRHERGHGRLRASPARIPRSRCSVSRPAATGGRASIGRGCPGQRHPAVPWRVRPVGLGTPACRNTGSSSRSCLPHRRRKASRTICRSAIGGAGDPCGITVPAV